VRREKVAESVSKLIALAIDNAGLYQTAQRCRPSRATKYWARCRTICGILSRRFRCVRARFATRRVTSGRIEIIDTIAESTGMMNRMIQDLLDVATIDSGHLRIDTSPHQVEPLLEQVLEMTKGCGERKERRRCRPTWDQHFPTFWLIRPDSSRCSQTSCRTR
jgi:signal transduction histidine kinase